MSSDVWTKTMESEVKSEFMSRVCKTCLFYCESENEVERFECRIDPPKIIVNKYNVISSLFPVTDENKWCGKHQHKREKGEKYGL